MKESLLEGVLNSIYKIKQQNDKDVQNSIYKIKQQNDKTEKSILRVMMYVPGRVAKN